ncbi:MULTISPECIES: hypothetical protein [Chryseobacterium]|uniref:Uncharacterized protein n=1 Tax=Chryseobacterium camelliae TaxID=1265445 RepID=A0ABU0TFB3_9FLAO|nr:MULTISPECIES: hypothetical protein [Chryseobacterium]MDT3406681.1 hypothetical protein [Pseudacidovorax intermedius]MDQ1095521.1 hypothetical protein [Chryseobacterium camelliae]MDQ1099458.1 hypothetical protein [Chryseobacterium sp. SORGH_AS_1048]MDR6086804.1 hypothetical protein [Chryseobacterium sp. SORGH_AS_0909]MDR6131177.1 hypothetical protein [Chryseobacterium sp. SORGH_AS_1175]
MNVSGIKIEKNSNGTLKTVTFDLEKYGKILQPILEDLGVVEDSRLQKKFYSLDEAKAETKRRLTELCRKDKLL